MSTGKVLQRDREGIFHPLPTACLPFQEGGTVVPCGRGGFFMKVDSSHSLLQGALGV